MTKQRAEEILADWRQLDGSLDGGADYVDWNGGDQVVLDSCFSLEFLKALVWWMENVEVVK